MSNPFESRIPTDPDAKLRYEAEIQRQNDQNEEERNRLRAEIHYTEAVVEYERYNGLIMEVLEQLRDAVYPGYEISSSTNSKGRLAGSWQVGRTLKSSHSFMGDRIETSEFHSKVTVWLQTDEAGRATGFKAFMHCGQNIIGALTKEALIEIIAKLYEPSPRTLEMLQHYSKIEAALKKIVQLRKINPYSLFDHKPPIYFHPPFNIEGLRNNPNLEIPLEESRFELGAVCYSAPAYSGDYDKSLVTVSLVFNDEDRVLNYECTVWGHIATSRQVAPDETSLFQALVEMTAPLYPIKESKKKKWWNSLMDG